MDAASDDASLARRIAAGDDPPAEEALCRRWFPRIRAYGRLHVGAAAAPDLAQEVLVIVIRSLREGRVTDVDRIGAYVSGVCRNVARDWKKGNHRRAMLLERFGPAGVEIATPPPSVERTRLIDCLRKLSARDRAVLALTYFADQDGDEIARELAMSPGNVRVTRHRALKQLLYCIGAEP
jgi:RNA polymerase sigma-70 factor, ECF subfamily